MSCTLHYKWFLCVLVAPMACASQAYGSDSDVRSSFLSAYRRAYGKLAENYTNVEFKYQREVPGKLVQWDSLEGKYKLHHYIARQEGRLVKESTRETTQTFPPMIEVANTKYAFQLLLTKTDGQYVINKLDILPPNGRVPFLPFMGPIADTYLDRTYLEIAEDPQTRFVSLADAKFRGLDVKELRLVVEAVNPVTKKKMSEKKNYYFSPEQGWLCLGWTIDFVEPGATKYMEVFYGYEGEGAYPPLKLIESLVRDRKDPNFAQLLWRIDFTKFTRVAPLDDAEFRLSAFGLPEPSGIDWKRPTPWYLWFSLAGMLCLVVGGVFYWLKRRVAGKTN